MSLTRLARAALALALGCALSLAVAAPAAAAPRQGDRPSSSLTALWDALSSFWGGLTGPPPGPAGPHGPQRVSAADHPHMDPNGFTTPHGGGEDGPDMDPNGANAEGDGGPDMDPDG